MSYDTPDIQEYGGWGNENFGGSAGLTHNIVGPRGKAGFVRDISCDITTAMVGTTNVPEIMVGISSGDSTYGRYRLGTAIGTGLGVGFAEASNEAITGNPPRTLQDFAGHVVLDGSPTMTAGVAGGTFLTVVPQGRIPASGMVVTNVVSGTAGVCRLTLRDPLPSQLVTGQTLNVRGVAGATGANAQGATISALSASANWIELAGSTFGGTYTTGGLVDVVAVVTLKNGSGGTSAGAGHTRVKIAWMGVNTP